MTTAVAIRKQRLRKLENEIRTGLFDAGIKLREIRDEELYKDDGYELWENYCRDVWKYSGDHATRLIKTAEYEAALPRRQNCRVDFKAAHVQELAQYLTAQWGKSISQTWVCCRLRMGRFLLFFITSCNKDHFILPPQSD